MQWISVEDKLPEVNEWVIVFEDDNQNPQNKFINDMLCKPQTRIAPAKIYCIDSDGYPRWHLCIIGGGPAGRYENVTHWMPMPNPPEMNDGTL